MLHLSATQLAQLNALAYEHYVERLTRKMSATAFRDGLTAAAGGTPSTAGLKALAERLIQRAASYGFRSEGDVTPFCLLSICAAPEFRQHGSYEWISAIIQSTQLDGESRMDAVYSLLHPKVRALVFEQDAGEV